MLIRVIIKNLYSFYKETEFNMLPGRISRLGHHKYKVNNLEVLKIASLYGANGAGKSNLIKAISLLQKIVTSERIPIELESQKFKLNDIAKSEPIYLGIEFLNESVPYYYSIEINKGKILTEELYISGKGVKDDYLLFTRNTLDTKKVEIKFNNNFYNKKDNISLENVILNDLLKPEQSLISLLNKISNEAFSEIKSAFNWFKKIAVIFPNSKPINLPFIFEKDEGFRNFANEVIQVLDIGIHKIISERIKIEKFFGEDNKTEVNRIKERLGEKQGKYISEIINEENIVFLNDSNIVYAIKLFFEHMNNIGNPVIFNNNEESDGTVRLLDYLSLLYAIIMFDFVYVVDEIERSIHPLLIKELIKKFSFDNNTKGQIIFTTHESNLLDQEIFRQDEIWFTEKDKNGTTELYPLSEFKEHHTIDISKGYINGRYGAIPFLGNLKDLSWDKYASD
jgi:uncharacterized protein